MTSFDAIIIGAGQAGPSLAGRLTGAGMKVALIERHLFGGTCVNTGCMPTKTLVASAYAARLAQRAAEYGVVLSGAAVDRHEDGERARAHRLDERPQRRREMARAAWRTARSISGHAKFEAPKVVRVNDEQLTAPRIFINVGGRAFVPDMPGVHDVPYLTNTSMHRARRAAPPPHRRRRQLHRPRVRADVSAVRSGSNDRRDVVAADQP